MSAGAANHGRGFFELSGLGLGVAAPDGVIRRAQAEAMDEAALIIERARTAAETMRREAEAAFEAEKQRGLAEGLAAARAEAAARLMAEHSQLESALGALEQDLAELVLGAVKQILHSFDDAELAREVVRSALATMRSEKRAQLHVAPSALDVIRRALDAILADYPEIELVDVIADPSLEPPNLRLESALGVVDFVLDDTFTGLRRLLRGE